MCVDTQQSAQNVLLGGQAGGENFVAQPLHGVIAADKSTQAAEQAAVGQRQRQRRSVALIDHGGVDVIVGISGGPPLLGGVTGEFVALFGSAQAAVQMNGGGVGVGVGKEHSQHLEKRGSCGSPISSTVAGLLGNLIWSCVVRVLASIQPRVRVKILWLAVSLTAYPPAVRSSINRLGPRGESAFAVVDGLPGGIGDQPRRQMDHLVDPPPDSARRQHPRIAGDARVGGVDPPRARAAVTSKRPRISSHKTR